MQFFSRSEYVVIPSQGLRLDREEIEKLSRSSANSFLLYQILVTSKLKPTNKEPPLIVTGLSKHSTSRSGL